MSRYELWYTDPEGNRLELLDTTLGFEYVITYGDIGACAINMPHDTRRVYVEQSPDRRVHIWRGADNSILQLDGIFFTRSWGNTTDINGFNSIALSGRDLNYLLDSRIVAYAAESSQAKKTDFIDDMMKEIFNENLLSGATDTDRDLSGLNLSVSADLGDGDSITKSFAWRNVLAVLQGLQQTSKALGTEVFFNIRATSPTSYIFETYTGQPNNDRTITTGTNPLIFGTEFGNVINPFYSENFIAERNYIYSGGRGQGSDRNIQEVEDTTRINQSVWNRKEGFINASGTTDATVTAIGNEALEANRPKKIFRATILSTPNTPYGGDGWRVGDKLTITYRNQQFDVLVRSGHVKVDNRGRETIRARVENVS